MYFVVLFASPLYFLLRKRWLGFVANATLYALAWITIWFGIGVVFWVLAVGHASWHLRREQMEEHARLIAREMAATHESGKALP